MGGAVMIGLGLVLAQPTLPVVVITGDGEMLMGMGSLATVALQQPKNLSIIVLDNEAYGETGGQTSHTGGSADLVCVAKACGIGDSRSISTMAEVVGDPDPVKSQRVMDAMLKMQKIIVADLEQAYRG